jgi:aldehyde:ferredoxin oxidoreductase
MNLGPSRRGALLIVDLETQTSEWSEIPGDLCTAFLGGRGLNAGLLQGRISPHTDPLGPDNDLILSCGLLTGTSAPSSSRLHIGAVSPLTGLLGSSNVGGHFGAEMRSAGVQALVVRGRALRPSVLRIEDHCVELEDASSLWGKSTAEALTSLRDTIGDSARLMAIGPAGENLVRFACILTGSRHAAGRTGMGAVMGSKNLKAIAVCSSHSSPRTSGSTREVVREYARAIRRAPRFDIYSRYSNSAFVNWADEAGILATRNYQHVRFEGADSIDGEQLIKYVTRSRSCHRCPVHCRADVEIREGPYAGLKGERPDIEPIGNLGSKCGLDDPEALLYLFHLAGDLGVDAISTGSVLAFAMELTQRGILSPEDTDGIQMTWGDADAMEAMMRRIAARDGFGSVLADGVRHAANLIGHGAEAYALHSKGLELTAYDPRGGMGTALGYAVSNRGGDFTSVYAVPEYRWSPEQGITWFGSERAVDRLSIEGKGQLVKRTMVVSAVLDSLGICKVPALSVIGDYSLENEARLTSALTDWHVDAQDLAVAGERILTLERLLNLERGACGEDDDLPDRFTEERVTDHGPTLGMTVQIQQMVSQFYSAMGWDHEGRPTRGRLQELGLHAER